MLSDFLAEGDRNPDGTTATRVVAGVDHWLCPMYPDRPELDFDPDGISALTEKQQAQWNKIQNANLLCPMVLLLAIGQQAPADLPRLTAIVNHSMVVAAFYRNRTTR
jgi:hypothetical protein